MKVERGKPEKVDKNAVQKNMEEEEYKLRVLMMKKKLFGLENYLVSFLLQLHSAHRICVLFSIRILDLSF